MVQDIFDLLSQRYREVHYEGAGDELRPESRIFGNINRAAWTLTGNPTPIALDTVL
jgi:hypothetical protein